MTLEEGASIEATLSKARGLRVATLSSAECIVLAHSTRRVSVDRVRDVLVCADDDRRWGVRYAITDVQGKGATLLGRGD
jgi:hypothetical protein